MREATSRVVRPRAARRSLQALRGGAACTSIRSPVMSALAPPPVVASVVGLRLLGFVGAQAAIAAILAATGAAAPWLAAAAWWPLCAAIGQLVTLAALRTALAGEGRRYGDLVRGDRGARGRDFLTSLAVMTAIVPATLAVDAGLLWLLFDDPNDALQRLFQPLPGWGVWTIVAIFPLATALAELPVYFGYALPRLAPALGRGPALWICAGLLSAQHALLPLRLELPFVLWRGLMFLPLALGLGLAVRRRPQLLPWFMGWHGLADLQTALMLGALS